MTALNDSQLDTPDHREESDLGIPGWLGRLLPDPAARSAKMVEGLHLSIWRGETASLVTVRLPDAAALDASALERKTVAMYGLMRSEIDKTGHLHPARIWNYLPSIHEQLEPHRDRYMVFNSGRFKAFCDWFGSAEALRRQAPTASGVGHRGMDMVIHCLAMDRPGTAIENPRQVPAVGYSKRYGPQPPCFARATLVDRQLLVGGTASIRGEQSVHPGDLQQQTAETFTNIAALVSDAASRAAGIKMEPQRSFDAFTSLRIYHPMLTDRAWIRQAVEARFPAVAQIEYLRADLCRAELLIEIEGVAQFA